MSSYAWGDLVRQLRNNLNLTQRQLASRLNIAPGQMGRIERGKVRPGICFNVANELNVPVSYLFGELASIEAFIAITCDGKLRNKIAQILQAYDIVKACYISSSANEGPNLVVKVSHFIFREIPKLLLDDCIIMRIEKSITWIVLKQYEPNNAAELPKGKQLIHSMILLSVAYDRQDVIGSKIAKMSGVQGCYAITGEADILVHCSSLSRGDQDGIFNEVKKIPGIKIGLKIDNLIEFKR